MAGPYLFLGPVRGSGLARDLATAWFTEPGGIPDGASHSIGDFDLDGIDDLVVADPTWEGVSEDGIAVYGRVQVWYGRE